MFYYSSFDDVISLQNALGLLKISRSECQKQCMPSKRVKDKEQTVRRALWIK